MKNSLLLVIMIFATLTLSAQTEEGQALKQTKEEIKAAFGTIPSFMDAIPKHALPGMWEYMKATTSAESAIPPKYRELIALAVAAQVPCDYCVFYHTESAKAYGATEQEIEEAVLNGAATRNWSTVLQGNQIDMEEFKEGFRQMMDYMEEQADEK